MSVEVPEEEEYSEEARSHPMFKAARQSMEDERAKTRASLYGAVTENPDKAAKASQISRQSGIPTDVVKRNLPEVERDLRVKEMHKTLQANPRLLQFLASPDNAAISHDDTGNLSTMEASVQALRGPAATFETYTKGLYKSVTQRGEMARQGLRMQFGDLINSQEMQQDASRKYAAAGLELAAATPEFESATARGVYSGLSSTAGQALPVAVGVALRNPSIPLSTMGIQTEAEAYGKYRARGASPADALYGAVHEGAIEVITEALPMGYLVKNLGKMGAGKFLAGLFAREVPSEQLATFLQDAVDTAVANPDKTWQQFLDERPGAAYETFIATLTQAGVMGAANTVVGKLNDRTQKAADTQKNTQLFGVLDGLSKASKVRVRDASTFQEFVKQAADGGPVTDVYISAATFAQSLQEAGVDIAQVAQAAPAVGEQLQEALGMGGDLKIPIEQFATAIAGSDFSQSLIPHLKTEAGGMSQLEAADFMANHGKELEAMVDKVLGEKKGDEEFKASRDKVVEGLRQQLNETGRFTDDVNLAKATLVGNFYAVQGAKVGQTAEEFAAEYALKVQATQSETGTAMDQSTPEFTSWFLDSKAVDEGGKPQLMYHGTPGDVSEFRTGTAGAIYVTPDQGFASRFSMRGMGMDPAGYDAEMQEGLSPNVMPVYASVQNPFDYESLDSLKGLRKFLQDRADEDGRVDIEMYGKRHSMAVEDLMDRVTIGQWEAIEAPLVQEYVKANHDGFFQREDGIRNLAVFSSTQLKSATGNQGTYDPNDPNVLHQSATIRSGKETLKKYGLDPDGKYKTREIAAALEARQRKKYGKIDRDDQSDDSAKKISKWMAEEVLFEMQHPEKSGVGWYSEKFQRALDIFAREFPEIATDKAARDVMTVLIAITSDGQKVVPNFAMAADLYGNFRATGKFTTERGHARQESINNNLGIIQELYETMGDDAMREYLMEERTVAELKKAAKLEGKTFSSAYQAHIKLPRAAVMLGPKLGAFYANLMGSHGYLTMDRWWSRTFNRYRGLLITSPTREGLDRFKQLMGRPEISDDEVLSAVVAPRNTYAAKNFKEGTEIEKAANTIYKAAFEGLEDTPFNATDRTFMLKAVALAQKSLSRRGAKMSVADIQAVLWYYEKRLYGELGARQTADISYEDAAKRVLEDRRAGIDSTGGQSVSEHGEDEDFDDTEGVREEDAGDLAAEQVGDETYSEEFFQSGSDSSLSRDQIPDGRTERRGRTDSQPAGTQTLLGRHESLARLPKTSPGSNPAILDIAAAYMRSAGLPALRQTKYVDVDPVRATAIAAAYSAMEHNPHDPDVAASYAAMISETLAQFQLIKQLGIKIEFIKGDDPYTKGPIEVLYDIRDNNHMWVFPTESGFGTENVIEDNPLKAMTDEVVDGRQLMVNDIFRIVHDVFGHAKEGNGFGAIGEENAWQSHAIMYSPLALKAMTSETRGQNSWVNFGPHGEQNKANPKQTIYADQKVGILPDWVMSAGTSPTMAVQDKVQPQTESAEFKAFFEGSAVTDENGNPMVVYHGTHPWEEPDGRQLGDIEAFDRMASVNIVRRKASIDTVGSWFSTNPGKSGAGMYGSAIYPVYLSIKKPQITTFHLLLRRARMLANGKDDGRHVGQVEVDAYRKWLKDIGKDGIKIVHDEGAPNESTEFKNQDAWIALEPEQIKSAIGNRGTFDPKNPNILKQADTVSRESQPARGSISFPKDIAAAPSTITLLDNADLSTFLHESGHFFLQVMADMATRPGAPQNVTDDMGELLRWFGVPDLATWNSMSVDEQRPHHEAFARGFEAYLLEGKAPTPELAPLYQKFRSWMLNVYKHLLSLAKGDASSALKVNLSPEVRAVMDRMIATSETIKEAEDAQGYSSLFETRPDGMTEAEWAEYQELGQQATQDAIHYLEGRSLRDLQWASNAKNAILKRLQKEADEKRAGVRAEVEAEVMVEPINQVRTFLRDGEIDGDPVPGPHKLSIEGLEEMYGDETDRYALLDWKALSTSGKAAAEGIHPDEMAADFGFRSGDELVQALLQEDTAQAKIDKLTDQKMLERYGDLTDAATIEQAASEAVHNDARVRFVATELAALTKAAGEKPLLAKAAKAFAEAAVARKKIRDIKPHEYAAAARKAAQAATKAMKAGDLQTAAVEKRNQLINELAAQAAHKALAKVGKRVTYLGKVGSTRAQKSMRGQAAAQMLAILDRFDIRKAQTLKEIDRRQALAEWAADEAIRLSAPPPLLSQKVLDEANRTHYRNLTFEEFEGLVDSVRQLEQLARREHKAYIELRNQTIQQEVAAGVAEIQAAFPEAFDNGEPKLDTPLTNKYVPSLGKKLKEGVRNIIAEFIPMEDLVERLTAGKFGQLHDSIFGRLSNAADRKSSMAGAVRDRLKPLLDAYSFKEKRDFGRREIPGTNMTRENLAMLALHWGNVEGRKRLGSQGFSEAIVMQRMSHLTAKDVDLINGIWDLNDNYIWPMYADLNTRTQGKAPAKVMPVPFTFTTVAGGNVTLNGGYIKLVYDSDFDESTRQRDSMADAMTMISGRSGTVAPKTDQGSSKDRVSDLSRMPLLELRAVAQAVNEHMHDIHFREAVADTVRILREPKMRDAIKAVAGKEVYTELLAKVNEIAARPVEPSGAVLRGLNVARRNTVVVLMSGVKTALVNYSGLVPALTRVNAGSLVKSLGKVHSHRMMEMIRFARAKSGYMRERQQSFTSDLQHQLDAMSVKNRILPEMGTFLILMRMIDQMTSTTVWLAGYQDGLKRFKLQDGTPDEERAIEYANTVTRSTQGSGREVDTSKIMTRFGPWSKLFTMFYSFFNKQAALLARQGLIAEREWTRGNRAKAVGMFTASYVAIVAIPAMINDLAGGKCDDAIEGNEGWGRCVSKALAMNMAGFVPIVRDLAPYAWSLVDDKDPTFGLRMTSISAYFEGVAKGAASTLEVVQGDGDEKDTKAIFMGLAFSFGLPGVLAWNVLAGTNEFLEGDAGPQAVLFGPPKK
jgi:hypothetical protein